jgi:hypothetical protein
VNHRVNARLHKLPPCPECNAFESNPCVTATGMVRGPHRIRERIADGDVVLVTARQAASIIRWLGAPRAASIGIKRAKAIA